MNTKNAKKTSKLFAVFNNPSYKLKKVLEGHNIKIRQLCTI